MRDDKYYALYHGDTYITGGTTREIAKYIGWKTHSVRCLLCKSYKNGNEGYVLVRVEEDE